MDTHFSAKRVLIADDDPDVAELLADLISESAPFPVEVALAPNGAVALNHALEEPPDCMILDIDMPVLDGVEAAIAVRTALGEDAPLLIAVTGDPRHAQFPRACEAFDHFFAKPADVDKLLAVLAQTRTPKGER